MTQQITNPRIEDIFFQLKDDIFNSFNCHRVGIISSFDPIKQIADVQLVDKATEEVFEGNKIVTKTRDYPLLSECPVFINKGASGGFTRPIAAGEYCLVHFNDRDIDNWFENGNIQVPNTKRLHNISDCLVTVGFFSESSPISNYDNEATTMDYQGSNIKLNGDVDINSDQGANINLDDKVGISNNSQDLKLLVTQLITVLQNFVSVDNPAAPIITVIPDNTTQANLNQLLTDFNELLK